MSELELVAGKQVERADFSSADNRSVRPPSLSEVGRSHRGNLRRLAFSGFHGWPPKISDGQEIFPERFRVGHRELLDSCFASASTRRTGKTCKILGKRKDGTELPSRAWLQPARQRRRRLSDQRVSGPHHWESGVEASRCLILWSSRTTHALLSRPMRPRRRDDRGDVVDFGQLSRILQASTRLYY